MCSLTWEFWIKRVFDLNPTPAICYLQGRGHVLGNGQGVL